VSAVADIHVLMHHTWGDSIGRWIKHLQAAGCAAGTVEQRRYHITRLSREVGKSPASLTLDVLVDWLAGHDWSPNTRRAYRASLRSFYSWALASGVVNRSPAHELPSVKIPRGRPRPTPEVEFARAVALADMRTRLALQLGGYCGLRRSEIAASRREDVEPDLTGWSLRVKGKGGHVRLVPLPDDVARTILERPAGWLFPSTHGGHLTPHHLGKLVSRALANGLTTHTLRHRCGTVAYAGTRDLRAVQELLGHAKPETTAIYVAVPDGAVRAAMLAARSPAA
jgi:integrase/recombinase XerC